MSDRDTDALAIDETPPPPTDADAPAEPTSARPRRNGTPTRPPTAASGRVPPHDIAAEEAVLGAAMLSKRALQEILALLQPTDFYRESHELIYRAIASLAARGDGVDGITVANELRQRGELADVGGAPYIHTLIAWVPTAANAGHYAKIVAEASQARRIINAATVAAQRLYEATTDAATTAAALRSDLEALPAAAANPIATISARELCELAINEDDHLLGPFIIRGQRVALGAYTGQGKTTFSLQAVAAVAHQREFLGWKGSGGRALVIDAEQGLRSIQRRLREAGVQESDQIDVLRVPDGLTLDSDAQQRAQLEAIIDSGGYDLVLADPLYKLHAGDSNDERHAVDLMRVFDRWRESYGFALLIPIHCRKPATQGGTKFSLHEFFGSGAFLFGAEVVVGIQMLGPGFSMLHWFKDRDGDLPIGQAWKLAFNRDNGGYRLLSQEPDPSDERILQLLKDQPGLDIDRIGAILDLSRATVDRTLKRLRAVNKKGPRGRKIWYPPAAMQNAPRVTDPDEEAIF